MEILKAHLWRGCPGVVSRAVAAERQSSDSRVILHLCTPELNPSEAYGLLFTL